MPVSAALVGGMRGSHVGSTEQTHSRVCGPLKRDEGFSLQCREAAGFQLSPELVGP